MEETNVHFQEIQRSCTMYNTRKAARAITELYETILSPSNVHATQFPLLVAVKAFERVSMSKLADGLQMDRTTLTRTLKPLQEKGWLEIAPGKDKRVQEVRLTAAGEEALAQAMPLWQEAQKQVQAHLGHESWAQLLRHLDSVAATKR